jgi:hypothetical protein
VKARICIWIFPSAFYYLNLDIFFVFFKNIMLPFNFISIEYQYIFDIVIIFIYIILKILLIMVLKDIYLIKTNVRYLQIYVDTASV